MKMIVLSLSILTFSVLAGQDEQICENFGKTGNQLQFLNEVAERTSNDNWSITMNECVDYIQVGEEERYREHNELVEFMVYTDSDNSMD
ncbi:TPA: hypothetical protein ACN4AY_004642 [Vibrio parahaemolyticus]